MARTRLEELEAENERLRYQLAELKAALSDEGDLALRFGLTPTEGRILALIARRGRIAHEALHRGLYFDRSEPAEPKTIAVLLVRLRQKLKPHGIEIRTVWGVGFELPPASLAVIRCPRDAAVTPSAMMQSSSARVPDEDKAPCSNSCSLSA